MPVPDAFKIPNVGVAGRTAHNEITLGANGIFSCLQNTSYAPFLGLDIAVRNVSGGAAVITLDGKRVDVPVAGVSITNSYYDEIRVVSLGNDGGLNLTLDGVLLTDLQRILGGAA